MFIIRDDDGNVVQDEELQVRMLQEVAGMDEATARQSYAMAIGQIPYADTQVIIEDEESSASSHSMTHVMPERVGVIRSCGRRLNRWSSWWLILGVRFYQVTLGPLLGGRCRFTPSCSHYFIEAVRKYGPWRGGWKGVCRLARCHPFCEGGHDPP